MPKGRKKRTRSNQVTEGGDDPEVIPDPPTSVAADKKGDPSTLKLTVLPCDTKYHNLL